MTSEQLNRLCNLIQDSALSIERAPARFGRESQLYKVIEECAELTDSICKMRSGRLDAVYVAEECADVLIMVLQCAEMVGMDAFLSGLGYKVTRLQELIAKAKP